MKLICVFCEKRIEPGEPLVASAAEELAHQACIVERSKPAIQIPIVTIAAKSTEMQHLPAGAVVKPCLMPTAPKKFCIVCGDPCGHGCSVCGKKCIANCPVCRKPVCQSYGYNGPNCSGSHESACPSSVNQRKKDKVEDPFILVHVPKKDRNGSHRNGKKKSR